MYLTEAHIFTHFSVSAVFTLNKKNIYIADRQNEIIFISRRSSLPAHHAVILAAAHLGVHPVVIAVGHFSGSAS